MSDQVPTPRTVFVTGASGYVGGRLVPALLARGHRVVCLARTPAKLDAAPWRDQVKVVAGSVESLTVSDLEGVDIAVYLVHAIGHGDDWAKQEQDAARHFGTTARSASVGHLVYLGGLGRDDDELSVHLASRHAVGRILAASGVPTTELRAGVIIGSGSASFEMLRHLVDALPLMITPRWVDTRCQPIAIADMVDLLVASIESPVVGTFEVGGPDIVSYDDMMQIYARIAGLPKRRLIKVPVLSPGLSSHWVGLVTPVPVPLARELVHSLVNEVVVQPGCAPPFMPSSPIHLDEAIRRALAATSGGDVPTRFDDADLVHFRPVATDPSWAGSVKFEDVRERRTRADAAAVFQSLTELGGDNGWGRGEWLWQIRGLIDQLVGGPGLRRGRKRQLGVGDPLDFWRVEKMETNKTLVLNAEMRLPGRAQLRWDIMEDGGVRSVVQTATFWPHGFLGRLYWWSVAPFHRFVFPGLLGDIVERAQRRNS